MSAITTSSTTTPELTLIWPPQDANGNPVTSLQLFADGLAGQYRRSDNLASNVPVALWGLGVYAMDEWKVKPNLTLTLAMRAERNSNPVCQINCFANFKTDFSSLPSVMRESEPAMSRTLPTSLTTSTRLTPG